MKTSLPLLLLVLFLPALRATTTVSVSTVPYGFETLSLPATTSTQTLVTYLAQPLLAQPVFSGGVVSVSTDEIKVAGTPWTSKQFTNPGSPYFLKITSGKQAGRFLRITANNTDIVTVDVTDQSSETEDLNASGFAVAANDSIEIIPGDTLASFFGTNTTANPLLLKGGTSVTTAETVAIYEPTLGKSLVYYFNTTSKAWACSTITGNQNNVVLYPETVFGITRRPKGVKLSLEIDGSVPEVAPLTKTVGGGKPIYGFTRLPVSIPLSDLTYTGWIKSTSVATADTIGIWDATKAAWQVYYQLPDKGSVAGEWRLSGNSTTNYSSLILPSGTGFQITKHAKVAGLSSFLAEPLPYKP